MEVLIVERFVSVFHLSLLTIAVFSSLCAAWSICDTYTMRYVVLCCLLY